MKRLITLLSVVFPLLGAAQGRDNLPAGQSTATDNGEIILIGKTERAVLETWSGSEWFRKGYAAYKPDYKSISRLKPLAGRIHVSIYLGSWCDDTHYLLPRFFRIADTLGISPGNISLTALNRQKKDDGNFPVPGVDRVPYFIFYYDGLETGKIIESVPKSIETSLMEIYRPYTR